jgi:hypothetical protein
LSARLASRARRNDISKEAMSKAPRQSSLPGLADTAASGEMDSLERPSEWQHSSESGARRCKPLQTLASARIWHCLLRCLGTVRDGRPPGVNVRQVPGALVQVETASDYRDCYARTWAVQAAGSRSLRCVQAHEAECQGGQCDSGSSQMGDSGPPEFLLDAPGRLVLGQALFVAYPPIPPPWAVNQGKLQP